MSNIITTEIKSPLKLKHVLIAPLITDIGAFCNILVSTVNGGMPVPIFVNGHIDAKHIGMLGEIKLMILADIIPIGDYFVSLGDLLMYFGCFIMIAFTVILTVFTWKTFKSLRAEIK